MLDDRPQTRGLGCPQYYEIGRCSSRAPASFLAIYIDIVFSFVKPFLLNLPFFIFRTLPEEYTTGFLQIFLHVSLLQRWWYHWNLVIIGTKKFAIRSTCGYSGPVLYAIACEF